MLKVEPTKVVFRDLRLNQPYTTSLCITNPLDVSVDFAIRPNHSRYQVSPSSVHLEPGKSIVVTLKAYLSNYPKINRGEKGFNDFILLVSSFFQQKIDLNLTFPKDTENHEPSSNHNTSSERTNPQAFSDEKFPDFEAILEERIQQERAAFEEQSQKVNSGLLR